MQIHMQKEATSMNQKIQQAESLTLLLFNRFEEARKKIALVTYNSKFAYGEILTMIAGADLLAQEHGCKDSTVLLAGDHSAETIACLLALWRLGNVVVLCCETRDEAMLERAKLSEAKWIIKITKNNKIYFYRIDSQTTNIF